ncbi:MAG: YibE/F family protein [Oscillospiraceae bacterium]|nr:YibE/F family protein [Oscillospiraceae bacterium]
MVIKMKIKKSTLKAVITHIAVIILALTLLYIGNRITVRDMPYDFHLANMVVEAKVTNVLKVTVDSTTTAGAVITETEFEAVITNSEHKGKEVTSRQVSMQVEGNSHLSSLYDRPVKVGDKISLSQTNDDWYFIRLIKIDQIVILGAAFVLLLLIFSGLKGLNTIISLGFTCAAVFAVFIPSILAGKNIYLSTIIVCTYSIIVTLFILYGVNKKSFAAVIGCFGGVIAACLLTLLMNTTMRLSGRLNEETGRLLYITENPIDLKSIVFAGIVIGAVGAIIDVSVSMSSALWELKEKAPHLRFKDILKSGMNIGKDIIGATTNTLVLAYVGSSLSSILLLLVFSGSLTDLLNRELVLVELLQALIGSLGILLTMPLTALVCAVLYTNAKTPSLPLVENREGD